MIIEGNVSCFSSKPYFVTPHLNCLFERVQMRGHNLCFYAELTNIISNYHQILPLIYSFEFMKMLLFEFYLNGASYIVLENISETGLPLDVRLYFVVHEDFQIGSRT